MIDQPRLDLQIDSSEDQRHHPGPEAGETVIQALERLLIPGWIDGGKCLRSIDKPLRFRCRRHHKDEIKVIDGVCKGF